MRFFIAIIGPDGLPDSLFDCMVSDVVLVCDAEQFPKVSHLSGLQFLLDVRLHCPGFAGHYKSTETESLIFELRKIFLSFQRVSLSSVKFWRVLTGWNLDL